MASMCGVLGFGFTIVVRNVWGRLYTSDVEVVGLTRCALPVVGVCEIGNSLQTAGCGVLVGSGRAKVALCVNVVCFYVVGLGVALVLAFGFEMGFMGFWFGLVAAQCCCACVMVWVVVFTDWDNEVEKAREVIATAFDEHASLFA